MSILEDTIFLQTSIIIYCKNVSANESCVKILHIQIITFLLFFQIHSINIILLSAKIHFCCF